MSLVLSLLAASAIAPASKPIVFQRHGGKTAPAKTQKLKDDPRDKGDMLVGYGPPCKDKAYADLQKGLKEGQMLERIAERLNVAFAFPHDVGITFAEIGEANAFYSPKDKIIVVGYEMFGDLMRTFAQEGGALEGDTIKILNALTFVIYHEIGHMLVDVLKLPVTGREEDAVDQFSVWMLRLVSEAHGTQDGGYAAVDAAKWFGLNADASGTVKEAAFWDSHSLNQQRFYDILTLVHGGDPKRFEFLIKMKMLPKERAANSTYEWQKIRGAWDAILVPHFRKN